MLFTVVDVGLLLRCFLLFVDFFVVFIVELFGFIACLICCFVRCFLDGLLLLALVFFCCLWLVRGVGCL